MSDTPERRGRLKNAAVISAPAVGLSAAAYGIAGAASDSGSSVATPSAASAAVQPGATTTPAAPTPPPADPRQPWGGQRSDETLLTGDTAAKVKEAALAKLPGAEVIRVETDAEGNAAYEAHVVTADGAPATAYVGKDFAGVSVEHH